MTKRTMQIIIVLGCILFLLGMLAGCGKSGKGFVGTYVYKDESGLMKTLEIKPDGTYGFSVVSPYLPFLGKPRTSAGTWEIKKEEGEEWISFTPTLDGRIGGLKKTYKGNVLVEPISGESYIKQAKEGQK